LGGLLGAETAHFPKPRSPLSRSPLTCVGLLFKESLADALVVQDAPNLVSEVAHVPCLSIPAAG
jgi:hypothetical protein